MIIPKRCAGRAATRTRAAVVADLERYFGTAARAVVAYAETKWSDDPFCRGVEAGY